MGPQFCSLRNTATTNARELLCRPARYGKYSRRHQSGVLTSHRLRITARAVLEFCWHVSAYVEPIAFASAAENRYRASMYPCDSLREFPPPPFLVVFVCCLQHSYAALANLVRKKQKNIACVLHQRKLASRL